MFTTEDLKAIQCVATVIDDSKLELWLSTKNIWELIYEKLQLQPFEIEYKLYRESAGHIDPRTRFKRASMYFTVRPFTELSGDELLVVDDLINMYNLGLCYHNPSRNEYCEERRNRFSGYDKSYHFDDTDREIKNWEYHKIVNVKNYHYHHACHVGELCVNISSTQSSSTPVRYFLFDSPGKQALSHWVFESFVFVGLYRLLKKRHPELQLITMNDRSYVKNMFELFGIRDSITIIQEGVLPNSNNLCYAPPVVSFNDNTLDPNKIEELIELYTTELITLVKPMKRIRLVYLPRNTVDNYAVNDRSVEVAANIDSEIVNMGGMVLNTYQLNNLSIQFSIVFSAEIILLDFGSSFFFNCAALTGKRIVVMNTDGRSLDLLESYTGFYVLYKLIQSKNEVIFIDKPSITFDDIRAQLTKPVVTRLLNSIIGETYTYDNVDGYEYESYSPSCGIVQRPSNSTASAVHYFVFDNPGGDAFAHWVFESFIYVELYRKLKRSIPSLKILTSNRKRYVKNILTFFGIDDEVVYEAEPNNVTHFHGISCLNDLNLNIWKFEFYLSSYIRDVTSILSSHPKGLDNIVFLPRNTVDNYAANDRVVDGTDDIKRGVIEKGGVVLNTYEINNITHQLSIVNQAKTIILDYGSSLFFNCIHLSGKTIIVLNNHGHMSGQCDVYPAYRIMYNRIAKNNSVKVISQPTVMYSDIEPLI